MGELHFELVSRSDYMFDVYQGGTEIGVVWREAGMWFASATSTGDKRISAGSRELAAQALADRLAEGGDQASVAQSISQER